MNNRVLKRPMFKMGGSSNEGITSGLDRVGYSEGTNKMGITIVIQDLYDLMIYIKT